jgi:hypothetical protein
MLILVTSCGQKSTIKNAVHAERLADAYGDGKHVIKNLTFPLTDSSLAYKTPLPGLGPITGGIMKFVGDIFAKNTDMGKLQMSYIQPLPEIPTQILNSVRLKRFFFYMKPTEKKRWREWYERWIMGKGNVTFSFLDKLAVRLSTTKLEDPDNYEPTVVSEDYNARDFSSLMEMFSRKYKQKNEVIDPERARDIILLKYHGKHRELYTDSDKYGQIHIMETTRPSMTKHFLMDHMKGFYNRILILDDSLLIELIKDPVADETFKAVVSDRANEMENLGVTYIDTCTPDSCLELAVPDVNLIPIATKGNALKLEAVIHAGKVPSSFKLKGFVEFEVKVDSPI